MVLAEPAFGVGLGGGSGEECLNAVGAALEEKLHEEMVAEVEAGTVAVHFAGAVEEGFAGGRIGEGAAFADVVGVAFADVFGELVVAPGAEMAPGEDVGEFVGDEVVEGAVARGFGAARSKEAIAFDGGAAEKDVGGPRDEGNAARAVAEVEEEAFAPGGVADVDGEGRTAGVEGGEAEFLISEGQDVDGGLG
ncbi:MAG: hypothetical protein SFV54_15205 [Bryobacteraceae bacterium]|nr:hypothetical protein [Bryobacteraceae bacterium]